VASFGPGGVSSLVALLERTVRTVLEAEGIDPHPAGGISVTLGDDGTMAELNRRYLERDGPTDVIAFALWETGEPVVGDVYVGWEQALRQAGDEGVDPREELVRLVVHGTLHALGWDHPDDPERRAGSPMGIRQEELVRAVGAGGRESAGPSAPPGSRPPA
jgi:probable rRNA maturation factor